MLNMTNCHGSAPATFEHNLLGYNTAGRFGVLATRWTQEEMTAERAQKYYLGDPEKSSPVSKAKYDAVFGKLIGQNKPFAHEHLYEEATVADYWCDADNASSLKQSYTATVDTLGKLGIVLE